METNKLVTINYQQFLLYSERKVMIYRKLMIWFTSWNSPKCHSKKKSQFQVHQDMKLNAGL